VTTCFGLYHQAIIRSQLEAETCCHLVTLNKINIYNTSCVLNCSTCLGWHNHPSSGAQTTVFTASGICHTVTATCRYRGRVHPHRSGFNFQRAVLSLLCVMFQVELSFVVNLSNVFLVQLPNFSLSFSLLFQRLQLLLV